MNRGNRKQGREGDAGQTARRRIMTTKEMEEEEARSRQAAAEAERSSEDDWEDDEELVMDEADEEEVIDDGDDDEYAEFQRESALSNGLGGVRIGATDEAEREGDDEVAVWRNDLGDSLEGDTKLEYENKAYDSFFQLCTEHPCLSFDIIHDNDGANRTKYPLSMLMVCGTQADDTEKNELVVLHVSNICRTKHDVESDAESDASYIGDGGDSGEDEDEQEVNDGEPMLHHRTISHYGTANRVRCAPQANLASGSQLVAVWSDAGHVQVFDLESELRPLVNFANWSKEQAMAWKETKTKKSGLKFCTPSSTHKVEGYGLDWSPVSANVFASGDCSGSLYVWQPSDDGRWKALASSTTEAAQSVEEIQWSPTQAEVLIATRAGGCVEVWDTRDMRKSKVSWQADPSDINVADWNRARQASHLLVTGADSGAVAIWDLRKLSAASPIQKLPWHTKSITSVEFSLHNESVLSVTGDDGQCTLWDLSLERDPSEEQEVIGELFGRRDLAGIPDQLMFQHQGLRHPKEAHWHAQIPGMVVTTDFEGLHIFRPMNWHSLMK